MPPKITMDPNQQDPNQENPPAVEVKEANQINNYVHSEAEEVDEADEEEHKVMKSILAMKFLIRKNISPGNLWCLFPPYMPHQSEYCLHTFL